MEISRAKLVISGAAVSPRVVRETFELSGAEKPRLLYDRTALAKAADFENGNEFIEFFHNLGARVTAMQTEFDQPLQKTEVEHMLDDSDVLFVDGGSTRRLLKEWDRYAITDVIAGHVESGRVVAAGASAGCMIWFDKGYSDSRQYEVAPGTRWNYILVNGCWVLPGWAAAHYGDTDEFGRDRGFGFRQLLKRHDGSWKQAVGIESFAGLRCVEGVVNAFDVRHEPQGATAHIFTPGNPPHPLAPGETYRWV